MQNFSHEKLVEFITLKDKTGAINYLNSYFFKVASNETGYYFWIPSLKKYNFIKMEDLKYHIEDEVTQITTWVQDDEESKPKKEIWSVLKYLKFKNHKHYTVTVNPRKEETFTENSMNYINFYERPKYSNSIKKYSDFSKQVHENVNVILNHLFEVISSSNKEAYEFILNWYCFAMNGGMTDTLVYLKGPEGAGKSSINEFLKKYVMGTGTFLSTKNYKILLPGQENADVMGKTMVVFEEFPTTSKNEWEAINSSLKDSVSCSHLEIKSLYKNKIMIENTINYMVLTNENALKINEGSRRFYIADVATHRIKDEKYFVALNKAFVMADVPEAFYIYMRERYEQVKDTFKGQRDIPMTETKQDMILEHLTPLLSFLKKYLLAGTDIHEKFSDFYDTFVMTEKKKVSKIELSKQLERYNFKTYRHNTVFYITITKEQLFKLFSEKKLISKFDEFEWTVPTTDEEQLKRNEVDEKEFIQVVETHVVKSKNLKKKFDFINPLDEIIVNKPISKNTLESDIIPATPETYESKLKNLSLNLMDF